MNMTDSSWHTIYALILCVLISAASCTDEKYDLDRFDSKAVVLKDITWPVGDINLITLADVLEIDDNASGALKVDSDGNIAFEFNSEAPLSIAVSVPPFDISFEESGVEGRKIILDMPSEIAGLKVSLLEQIMPEYYAGNISYEDLTGSPASVKKAVTISDEFVLSHYINDIKEIALDAEIMYEFSLGVKDIHGNNVDSHNAALYVEKGMTIDFPDWLAIYKNDEIDAYVIENKVDNKNVLTFIKDMRINNGSSIVFDMMIAKADVPAGFIVDGGYDEEGRPCKRLDVDVTDEKNMILIDGDIYLKPSDFDIVPKSMELNMDLSFMNMDVKSALVSLNAEMEIPDQSFSIPAVPEMLTGEGTVIDIYDPHMLFWVSNNSPLDINFHAHLSTYRNNVRLMDMYLSESGQNDPLVIPKKFNGTIGFSRRGTEGMIANPHIAGLFRTLPDMVKVDEIEVSASDELIRIYPGQTMECSVGYGFHAPLAFGTDFAIETELLLKDLAFNFEGLQVSTFRLAFDAVNTIPLSLDVKAIVLDQDGIPVNDIEIEADSRIQAGSLDRPSLSSVEMILKSKAGSIHMDGLKLLLTASCPEGYQGTALNISQGLEIKKLKIGLPDGISVDMELDKRL